MTINVGKMFYKGWTNYLLMLINANKKKLFKDLKRKNLLFFILENALTPVF